MNFCRLSPWDLQDIRTTSNESLLSLARKSRLLFLVMPFRDEDRLRFLNQLRAKKRAVYRQGAKIVVINPWNKRYRSGQLKQLSSQNEIILINRRFGDLLSDFDFSRSFKRSLAPKNDSFHERGLWSISQFPTAFLLDGTNVTHVWFDEDVSIDRILMDWLPDEDANPTNPWIPPGISPGGGPELTALFRLSRCTD